MTWKQDKVKTSQEKHNNLESRKREVDTCKQDMIKTSQKKPNNLELEKGRADTPQ
jgi:hypothetical protein